MKKLTWGYATILTLEHIIAIITAIILCIPLLFISGIALGIQAVWATLRPGEE